ncbi:hypothetical protein NQ317_010505 [Molorchus minor]|uniref:Arrestin C-terminal-like domain-containing protein n=1 Tax=Molorchus minor TaxID=1323400 RepID=A0ABQ9ITE0_9CUCU|nr:hypothetical protein NQ317_010505 [Molorchus minor]
MDMDVLFSNSSSEDDEIDNVIFHSAFVEVIGQEATSWVDGKGHQPRAGLHPYFPKTRAVGPQKRQENIPFQTPFRLCPLASQFRTRPPRLPDDRSVYSEVSEYSFTFAVKLPKLIPSTYTDNLGVVMYFAKATVLISGFFQNLGKPFPSLFTRLSISIVSTLLAGTVKKILVGILAIISTRLNNTLLSNCRHIGTKFFGQQQNNNANKKPYFKAMEFPFSSVCGIDKYALYMDIYVPKRAILLGEKINVLVRVTNCTGMKIANLNVWIGQSVKTRGNKPEYGIQFSGTLLAMVSDVGIRDLKEKTYTFVVEVPEIAKINNFEHCKLFGNKCWMKVNAEFSDGVLKKTEFIPIIIGHIPHRLTPPAAPLPEIFLNESPVREGRVSRNEAETSCQRRGCRRRVYLTSKRPPPYSSLELSTPTYTSNTTKKKETPPPSYEAVLSNMPSLAALAVAEAAVAAVADDAPSAPAEPSSEEGEATSESDSASDVEQPGDSANETPASEAPIGGPSNSSTDSARAPAPPYRPLFLPNLAPYPADSFSRWDTVVSALPSMLSAHRTSTPNLGPQILPKPSTTVFGQQTDRVAMPMPSLRLPANTRAELHFFQSDVDRPLVVDVGKIGFALPGPDSRSNSNDVEDSSPQTEDSGAGAPSRTIEADAHLGAEST